MEKTTSELPGGLLGGIHALFHGSDLGCAYGGMSCPQRMRLQQLLEVTESSSSAEEYQRELLHIAVCQAVSLMNSVIHKQEEGRQAHDILRQALVDCADDYVSERTKLIREQQRSGSGGVTGIMVSPASNSRAKDSER